MVFAVRPVSLTTSSLPNKKHVLDGHLQPLRQSKSLSNDQMNQLEQQGYTKGLARAIVKNTETFSLRIWVVDNSGSMSHNDGHRFIETKNNSDVRVVPCTRWKEIQETVEYHARMAALLKAPTVFRLLNDPGRNIGPQVFGVANNGDNLIDWELEEALRTIKNAKPSGSTPLCRHIYDIRQTISNMSSQLHAEGRKVSVVVATDGLPSDDNGISGKSQTENFKNALRSLEGLPVWITIRLCTDEESVLEFYNSLDAELELSIEVLDDFMEEATEIYRHNKWLNYTLSLHRCREMGFHDRIFDLLDERKLTEEELHIFCMLVLGKQRFKNIPDPSSDLKGFLSGIKSALKEEKKQFHPIRMTAKSVISHKKLRKTYASRPMRLYK